MTDELNKALKKGSKNGRSRESSLQFKPVIKTEKDGLTIQIVASDEYWYYIEKGRKAGKMPPQDAINRDWFVANKIDPRKVIAEINAKSKKGGLKTSKL
jgi:hypothetical protein